VEGRRCAAAELADQQVSPAGFAFVPMLTKLPYLQNLAQKERADSAVRAPGLWATRPQDAPWRGQAAFSACYFRQIVFINRHDHLDSGVGDAAVAGRPRLPPGRHSRVVLARGIIVSALLSGPLAKYVQPMLPHVGIHDPTVIWLLSPVVVFAVLLIPFKSAGFFRASQGDLYFNIKPTPCN